MKHEKGFGCFMAPKSGVGRVWEGAKWFRRVWWAHGSQEWGGKDGNFCGWRFRWSTKAIAAALDPTPFNETWKRGWVFLMVPKSGVGRVWSIKKRFTVPKSGVGRAWEGRKMKHEKGFGCFMVPKRGVGRVWEGSGKAKNEAWKQGCVLHGSQEWGGKGLGRAWKR